MAEAALKSLPSEGASEASRLMILCRKCVQVGSMPAPYFELAIMDLAGLSDAILLSCAKGIHDLIEDLTMPPAGCCGGC